MSNNPCLYNLENKNASANPVMVSRCPFLKQIQEIPAKINVLWIPGCDTSIYSVLSCILLIRYQNSISCYPILLSKYPKTVWRPDEKFRNSQPIIRWIEFLEMVQYHQASHPSPIITLPLESSTQYLLDHRHHHYLFACTFRNCSITNPNTFHKKIQKLPDYKAHMHNIFLANWKFNYKAHYSFTQEHWEIGDGQLKACMTKYSNQHNAPQWHESSSNTQHIESSLQTAGKAWGALVTTN